MTSTSDQRRDESIRSLLDDGSVAVVGAGYMGGGIAQTFALCGVTVRVTDVDLAAARRSVERLCAEAGDRAAKGLMPEGAELTLRERLVPCATPEEAVADATYVSEAIPEDPVTKRDILRRIESVCPSDTIIATNTSAIPIRDMARVLDRPDRFLGVHWMNPAYFVPGVEVIPSNETSRSVIDRVVTLLDLLGKRPTLVADSAGFIANRLQFRLFQECLEIVESGLASPAEIDEVVRNSFGYRLPFYGPFEMADMAGLDVYRGAIGVLDEALGSPGEASGVLDTMVRAGHLGVKSGRGFYEYSAEDGAEFKETRDRAYWMLDRLRSGSDDAGKVLVPVDS